MEANKAIWSPNYSRGRSQSVRLVVVHTAEGARTVDSLGGWFGNPAASASSHVGIDDDEIAQYVRYEDTAWTMLSANPYSDQAELCGFAAWTRADWLAHPGMLRNTGLWIRSRCQARGVPIVKLSPAEVGAGHAGVCGHADYSQGTGDGDHWDPGPNFPWDIVMDIAAGGGGTTPTQPADFLEELLMAVKYVIQYVRQKGDPTVWSCNLLAGTRRAMTDMGALGNDISVHQNAGIPVKVPPGNYGAWTVEEVANSEAFGVVVK